MWVTVVVHDQDTFDRSSHTEILIVVLQTLKTSRDGGIFFWLRLLRAVKQMGWKWSTAKYICGPYLNVKFERG